MSRRKIEVGNLPGKASGDLLVNFFESKFGEVQVEDVQISSNRAVVTFINEADVDFVLENHRKHPCKLSGRTLDVCRITRDDRSKSSHADKEPGYSEQPEDGDTDTIEVRGFRESVSSDTLQFYFENQLRSGGGPIVDFRKAEDYAHIRFQDKNAISRVLAKSHKVDDCELHVKPLVISRRSLLLSHVPLTASAETLENYVESRLKCEVESVTFSVDKTRAVVDFKQDIDLEQARRACSQRPLLEVYLSLQAVPVTCSMLVTGVQPELTRDSVQFYFENEKRTGGGPIEEVEMFYDEGLCLVHFKHAEHLRSVCRRSKHELSKISLTVKPYHRCLGAPCGQTPTKLVIPPPVIMSDEDYKKLKVTARRPEKKNEIDSKLSDIYAKIDWNDNQLRITCQLTDSVERCHVLAKTWPNTVREALAEYTEGLEAKVSTVTAEVWKEAKSRLAGQEVKHPDRTSLLHENDELVLVAPREDCDAVWGPILTAVDNAARSLRRRSEVETDDVKLQVRWQIEYLQAANFPDNLKDKIEHVTVKYFDNQNMLVFTGPKENITTAKMLMFEQIHHVNSQRIHVNQAKLHLLKEQHVTEQLKQSIHDQSLVCALEITDDTIIIHGTDHVCSQVSNILDSMLANFTIKLSQNVLSVLKSSKWDQFVGRLCQDCEDCVQLHLPRDDTRLEVCTLEKYIIDVRQKVEDFLQENAIETKRIDLREPAKVRYIERYRRQVMEREKEKCRCQPKYKFDGSVVIITGTEEDVDRLTRLINEMADGIHGTHHRKRHVGIQKFLACPAGRDCLQKVEASKKCVIQVQGGEDKRPRDRDREGPRSESQPAEGASGGSSEVTINGNIKIKVQQGDMTEQRKDVIVVTASKNLHFRGRLHDKILRKGGRDIKSDCDARIKRKGQLRDGEVYLGSGGDLPCKAIAHVVIAPWDSGTRDTETLKSVVTGCLQKSDKRGCSSIVIPGLGTGQLGYPTGIACDAIVRTIKSYFEKASSSSITKVILCDVNGEILRTFDDCLEQCFGTVERKAPRGGYERRGERGASREHSRSESPGPSGGLHIGGVQISVVVGHLAKEKVDVIVDSAPADLSLKKGKCSHALLDAGGYRIQQECKDNYPRGIKPGKVAVTTGGKLRCDKIFHITLRQYSRDEHEEAIAGLRSSIDACLEQASRDRDTSIAIPSAGTGSMKYPSTVVAREMFACITGFFRHNQRSSLKSVRLVIFPGDTETVEAFHAEERKCGNRSTDDTDDVEVVHTGGHNSRSIEVQCQGAKVFLVKAHLAKEKSDVIVNSTSQELKLDKGLASKAILTAAGPGIQQECAQNFSGGITVGQVAVTSPGNLGCKKIFHIAVPPFEQDNGENCMQGLAASLTQCLTEADKLGLTSISIPPVGLGALKYPKGWTAGKTYSCIEKYLKSQTGSGLKTIRLVVFPQDDAIFQVFKKEAFKRSPDGGEGASASPRRHDAPSLFMSKEKNECTLKIFSDSRQNTAEAARMFDETVEREWCSRKFEDREVIPTLHPGQVKAIKEDFKQNNVFAHIDVDAGTILAYGLARDLLEVSCKVDGILQKQHKYLSLKKEARLTKNMVRWYYLVNQKEVPVGDVDSMNMEKAYQKKSTQFQVKNRKGETYVIDFQKMLSYPSSQPNQTSQLIRRDIMADTSGSVPSHWTKGNASDAVTLVPLNQGSQEYTKVLNDFTRTLGRNPNIIKIERVQNKTLYIQYAAKLRSTDIQNKSKNNVTMLWHGTSPNIVPSIYTHGFNRSYCSSCSIGNGVYFAVNSQYSDGGYSRPDASGHKRMFRCLVITGQTTQGQGGLRVPPQRTTVGGAPVLYDSVTDNPGGPSMYVIFHDCQAYPEHLITYT